MNQAGNIWISGLIAVLAACAACINFRVPPRHLPVTAGLAFLDIILDHGFQYLGLSEFFICLLTASLAQIAARITKSPAQGFLVPAFIFLVPGVPLYRMITAMAAQNMTVASSEGVLAITMTLNISFAVLIANWLIPARTEL